MHGKCEVKGCKKIPFAYMDRYCGDCVMKAIKEVLRIREEKRGKKNVIA